MVKVLSNSTKKHEIWHKHRLICAVANEKVNQKFCLLGVCILLTRSSSYNFTIISLNIAWTLDEKWMSMKKNNLMDHTVTNFIVFFSKKWQSMQVIYWPGYGTARLQWKSFIAKDLCLKKQCCIKKCNCCYSFGLPSHILVCKITIPLNYL